jgi:hypothetical protein
LAPILGDRSELIEAAAFLHDIGYSSVVRSTGFHPLDGARYLRDVLGADLVICQALTYCDLTADVNGCPVDYEERLSEILGRYPRDHVVHRSIVRSGPFLRQAATNVERRLSA